jgi:hypothetical protein
MVVAGGRCFVGNILIYIPLCTCHSFCRIRLGDSKYDANQLYETKHHKEKQRGDSIP